MKINDKVLMAKLLLKITFTMMIISVFLKILGFNLFEADYENGLLQFLSNFIDNTKIKPILNFLILYIQTFVIFKLSCINISKYIYIYSSLVIVVLGILFQLVLYDYVFVNNQDLAYNIYNIFSFLILFITIIIIDFKQDYNFISNKWFKNFYINKIKKPLIIFGLILFYQIITLFLRNLTPIGRYDTLYNFLLNFDYLILVLTTYYIHLKKESNFKVENEFNFTLTKLLNTSVSKRNLKNFSETFKKNFIEFKKQTKVDKIVFILYVIFFIVQECLTLGLIIFIANLNNYLIECMFILIAFTISKKVFGAFHFNSFIVCFVVSNITFFILSKFTLNVSITFVIPILCGITLSYIASRFIKKNNSTPYRGMPIKDMENICESKNLNKIETGILIDYYCNRYNLEKIAHMYNYSDRSIQRIKSKALQKLEL